VDPDISGYRAALIRSRLSGYVHPEKFTAKVWHVLNTLHVNAADLKQRTQLPSTGRMWKYTRHTHIHAATGISVQCEISTYDTFKRSLSGR